MYKKIMVPLDGSRLAEASLDYAAWLAPKAEAELVLFRVYSGQAPGEDRYLKGISETLMSRAQQTAQPPARIKTESLQGEPAAEILRYIDENKIDLIVMTTHGHTGVRQWLLGSVADRVVRNSGRPVRLIKSSDSSDSDQTAFDGTVLALLDGSELAEQILPYAAYHAGLQEGELVLLHICEPPEIIPAAGYHLVPHGYPPRLPLKWEKYVEEETLKQKNACNLYLEKLVDDYGKNKIKVRSEYLLGKATDEIPRYLKANRFSLVAMTTRGRSGLVRSVFGSVAEKVLSTTTRPILIMKPG